MLQSLCPVAVPGEPPSAATAEAPRGLAAMAPPPYKLWVVLGKSPPLELQQPGQLISLESSTALDCTFF